MHTHVLKQLATLFKERGIVWGVGGSVLLKKYALIDSPADVDVIIRMKDCEKVRGILDQVAKRIQTDSKPPFKTACFQKYELDGTFIDMMGGFAIGHENGPYHLEFDENSITSWMIDGEDTIHFTSLEDWYVLYQLIPNKGEKAVLIEEYWKKNGIENPYLLENALQQPLPEEIEIRCRQALEKSEKECL